MPLPTDQVRRTAGVLADRAADRIRPHVRTGGKVHALLKPLRKRLPRAERRDPLVQLLAVFAKWAPTVFFIQIGANDGSKGDYLDPHLEIRGWSGLLVEPIPYVFGRLEKRRGQHPRLTLVNAAISDSDGSAEIYYLPKDDGADLPEWYDALASFRREVIASHVHSIPDIESRIATIEVPTVTFDTLCRTYGVEKVDLIQVDTEGYDYEVIRQVDLDRYRPSIVLYEHRHLRADEKAACEELLLDRGYLTISNFMDTLAVRADGTDRKLRRLVRLLRRLQDQ